MLEHPMKLNINWSKVSIIAVAITGILSVAFIAPLVIDQVREYRATQLHPHPANDKEQVEILSGVLKDEFFTSYRMLTAPSHDDDDSIVLISSSLGMCEQAHAVPRVEAGCISAVDRDQDERFVQGEPGIPRKLLQELFAANRASSILPDPQSPTILCRPQAAIESLMNSTNGWNQFYTRFPHSRYAIEVSRAVLSEDGTHALIHAYLFIPHGSQGVLYYLIRNGDSWRVEKANGPVTT
jgi:hypothetical protein